MNICTVNAPSALLLRFAYYLSNKNYAPALLHMHTTSIEEVDGKAQKKKRKIITASLFFIGNFTPLEEN